MQWYQRRIHGYILRTFNSCVYFVLLMKSHLQSYPCPLQINAFWNVGFLLGIAIMLQIVTGIFLALHYTSDLNSAYFSIFFLIREVYYGWSLRYFHSNGASFVFLFLFLHIARAIFYGSYFYNPNTWFSGILILFLLMAIAFMGYVLPFGQMSFWGATVIINLLSAFPSLVEWFCGGLCLQSNIEEVLSLSLCSPISSLWFCNSSSFLSSFSFFFSLYIFFKLILGSLLSHIQIMH